MAPHRSLSLTLNAVRIAARAACTAYSAPDRIATIAPDPRRPRLYRTVIFFYLLFPPPSYRGQRYSCWGFFFFLFCHHPALIHSYPSSVQPLLLAHHCIGITFGFYESVSTCSQWYFLILHCRTRSTIRIFNDSLVVSTHHDSTANNLLLLAFIYKPHLYTR